ncbi:MAG: hypothetical protein IJX85_12405 [Lachnospiraceae bacterium]|nr:hypothetical protein [Lachnospiraceae bacterium]
MNIIIFIGIVFLYLAIVLVYSRVYEAIFEDEGEEEVDGKRRQDETNARES